LQIPGFDQQLAYYNDPNANTPMGYSTGYRNLSFHTSIVLMGHNPGPFTPIVQLRVGDAVEYWNVQGQPQIFHVISKKVFSFSQAFQYINAGGSRLYLYTCYVPDGSSDWVIEAN
jgi:sortase (surface protein transpeptidase)